MCNKVTYRPTQVNPILDFTVNRFRIAGIGVWIHCQWNLDWPDYSC